ncbi:MAG: rod shape-determining protein MreC, partial [Deltaproteobacteria bacterium]|nr:rod shape-determining protein MreC [Deltaproteobacteria bacterium]
MIDFFRRYQILLSSFFCLLFAVYILGSSSSGRLRGDPVGPLLLEIMRPFQRALTSTITAAGNVKESYLAVNDLWTENQQLKDRVVHLEGEINQLREAQATVARLRQLLAIKKDSFAQAVGATVIGTSASTWFQSLTIDKGTRQGIAKGMAVISPHGVVGQIWSVAPNSSKVLLVTDHNSGVDVIAQRTRARGIVSGSLDKGPVMEYVTRNENIREGDRLITSGLDNIFPKGQLVGTVGQVQENSYGLFQDVSVKLAVDPERI